MIKLILCMFESEVLRGHSGGDDSRKIYTAEA